MNPISFEGMLRSDNRITVPKEKRDGLTKGRTYQVQIVDEVEEEEETTGALDSVIERESPG